MINTAMFFLSSICVILLLGMLIITDEKTTVWRRGIYAGFFGSGASAFGFAAPVLNPYPIIEFMLSITLMLACVVYSYYVAAVPSLMPLTTDQETAFNNRKYVGLKYMGSGLVLSLFLAVVVSFTTGQQDGTRVQISFAQVVYALAEEVKSLHKAVNSLQKDVNQLKENDVKKAREDSTASGLVLKGQGAIMNQLTTKKRH